MGIAYRIMYAIGFTPWDGVMPNELKRVIEGPDALPKGRALDLGCGKGTKAIYMAGTPAMMRAAAAWFCLKKR